MRNCLTCPFPLPLHIGLLRVGAGRAGLGQGFAVIILHALHFDAAKTQESRPSHGSFT